MKTYKLWEEYVLIQMRKYIDEKNLNLEIVGQDSMTLWTDSDTNYSRQVKPDIVVKKGQETYIIDTKWKRPQNNSASIEDIRQMYTYNRIWKAKNSMLLYPGDPSDNRSGTYFDEVNNEEHSCMMNFVSVLNTDNNLDENIGRKILFELGI